jgi:hypothetical protein
MRHYQCDSPEAAARIIAACLLSDGHVGREELEALEAQGVEPRLALHPGQFIKVVQALCEDLTTTAYLNWGDVSRIDPIVIIQLAADVQDWRMRRDIIWLCKEAVHADAHISEGEADFIRLLRAAWQLPAESEWVHPRKQLKVARSHR